MDNISPEQQRLEEHLEELENVKIRYTQLVELATTADAQLVFADPGAIAKLAGCSPGLQAALESRWGVEKYGQFMTSGVNIEGSPEQDSQLSTSDVSLFLIASMRTELLTLAQQHYQATGGLNAGRLCSDPNTAMALLTLASLDETVDREVQKLDRLAGGRLIKDLRATVKEFKKDKDIAAGKVIPEGPRVDVAKTSPERLIGLYDVTYVLDAVNVLETVKAPGLKAKIGEWLKQHKHVNSVVKVTPASVGVLAVSATASVGVPTMINDPVSSLNAFTLAAGVVGACVAYYKTGQKLSKAAVNETDQSTARTNFTATVNQSRRIQLQTPVNTVNVKQVSER